eukprot:GGOE01062873.1.p2 GENE.GGOE01062873.1~~GGOE01062873.1.p2  ORF type:complete len:104 (+),score=23.84 GGOE01062873.1:92-403(+)
MANSSTPSETHRMVLEGQGWKVELQIADTLQKAFEGYQRCARDSAEGEPAACRGLAGRLLQMRNALQEYYTASTEAAAPPPSMVVRPVHSPIKDVPEDPPEGQ